MLDQKLLPDSIQLFKDSSLIKKNNYWSVIYNSDAIIAGSLLQLGNWSTIYDENSNRIGIIKQENNHCTLYNKYYKKIGYINLNTCYGTVYDLDNNKILEFKHDGTLIQNL